MNEILEILSKNAKASPSEIAALLGSTEEDVAKKIKEFEESGVITKYITLINWEKLEESPVFAVLDLKVALQRKTVMTRWPKGSPDFRKWSREVNLGRS